MKIVINRAYGGFGLSDDAMRRYAELKDIVLIERPGAWGCDFYIDDLSEDNYFSYYDIERDDPALVQVVEEMQENSYGIHAELSVVEIPDDVSWYISNYDGMETIHENHRSWY